jgi:hypothetical protein
VRLPLSHLSRTEQLTSVEQIFRWAQKGWKSDVALGSAGSGTGSPPWIIMTALSRHSYPSRQSPSLWHMSMQKRSSLVRWAQRSPTVQISSKAQSAWP